jgi:tRNA pseudouridine(38-40) synthase
MIGRAKTGKSNRVLQEIKEQSGTGKQILLVPEHASYQAEVDLCRVCGNAVSRHAEVLSFQRLFNRVMSRTGGLAAQTLDAGGKILTMQLTMMDLAPVLKVYRHPSQRTAFLRNMLDLFDEFRTYQVTPEQLMQQTERMEGATRDKLQDLSLLYSEFERRITSGNCDARDYVTRLSEKLEESGYVRDKDIFVDGFAYFTAKELLVLQIMMKQARSVTVVLMGDESSDEEVFQSAVRMKENLLRAAKDVNCKSEVIPVPAKETNLSDLEHLERYFFGENQTYERACSSIRVLEGWKGAPDFDSCRGAKRKTYRYTVYEGERENPLLERYATRVEKLPQTELLQSFARYMEGEHDFKAFCASGSSVKTTVRTVYSVQVVERKEYATKVVDVFVTGNGFLYNMVRTMVGELLDLANGRKSVEQLLLAYSTGDRSLLGKTLAAKGLTMVEVVYQDE